MARSPIRLGVINAFCAHQPKLLTRGQNSYRSNHVKSVTFYEKLGTVIGTVQASMTSVFYKCKISMKLSNSGAVIKISDGHCTCKKGNAVCHHMMALLLHAHYNLGPTDVTCQWSQPNHRQDRNTGGSVDELYPRTKPGYRAIPIPLTEQDLHFAYRISGMCGERAAGALWLLGPSPENDLEVHFCIKTLIESAEFKSAINKISMLLEFMALSSEEIVHIASVTCGQGGNDLWLLRRLYRITASVFGDVLKCIDNGRKPCKSLMEKFFKPAKRVTKRKAKPGEGLHARQWGHDNESEAITKFEEKTGMKVEATGLWLDPNGKLGASPDGLVGSDAIVEVKCPFSIRDQMTVKEGVNKIKDYTVSYDEYSDEWVLNEDHKYFHQIQGQLYLTERSVCYLILWLPADCEILAIPRQDSWAPNLSKLNSFFDTHVLPQLLQVQ